MTLAKPMAGGSILDCRRGSVFECRKQKLNADGDAWLAKPFRILKLAKNFPVQMSGIKAYDSLKELRRNDLNWKSYHKLDSKSAVKICENRHLVTSDNFVITPNDKGFSDVSYKILKHGVFGELKSDISGIHLDTKLNKYLRAVTQLKAEDKNGVWIAKFEYYSEKRDKVYHKESSFFPKTWCPTIYMFEVYSAYIKLEKIVNTTTIYQSITKSNVPVEFIIKNGIVNTVYPIYQETEKSLPTMHNRQAS